MCIGHFISGKVTRLQLTMKLHIIVGDVLKSELPFFDVCIANSCRTRSPHLSCSSCCCCYIETSITVPKESVPATPVNQPHGTWQTELTKPPATASLPPANLSPTLPSAAASAGNNTLSRTCTSHASVRRALKSRAATYNTVTRTGTQYYFPVPTSAVPSWRPRAWVRPTACARVIRNVDTFKQAVQYQTCPNQLIFLIFLVPQHGGRDVMWKHPIWSYGHEAEEYIFLNLPFPSNPKENFSIRCINL